jgi:hypothetical protein
MANCWKNLQTNALKLDLPGAGVVSATINGHFMAAGNQTSGQMFRECFKAAVVRGNPTRSENRNTHKTFSAGVVTSNHKPERQVEENSFFGFRFFSFFLLGIGKSEPVCLQR